jgi:hypothetical protein
MLFRISLLCRHVGRTWGPQGLPLPDSHVLPPMSALDGAPQWAEVRAGWNAQGLVFNVRVAGKRHPPWCRSTQMDESDGLHVWIDTRDTHNVHRATRFCHRFAFLPGGSGPDWQAPCGGQLAIHRARDQARPARQDSLKLHVERTADGYLLHAWVGNEALTGYDPAETRRLGFNYLIRDRERGDQTLSVGGDFPYDEDPSLWATLELVA